MPDEPKLDPFKPQQPSIPGVAPRTATAAPEPSPAPTPAAASPGAPRKAQPKFAIMAVAGAVVLILLIGLIFAGRGASRKAAPVSAAPPPPAAAPAAEVKIAPSEPVGPGVIATTSELAQPWSAKRFQFRSYVTGQLEPAMVVRLPHGDYWGFSLIEPFGNCQLEFVTDLGKLKSDYGYKGDHPMVADPCNRTVYDLLKYGGGASGDDLVRGAIVHGNGIRPPMAIEIKTQGANIVATRSE